MQPAQLGVALALAALISIMAMQNGQPPAIAFAVGAAAFGLVIGVLGQGAAQPAPAPVAPAATRAPKAQKAPKKAAAPRKPEPVPVPEPEPEPESESSSKKKKKKKKTDAAPVSPPPALESESSSKKSGKKKSGKSAAAAPAPAAPAAPAAKATVPAKSSPEASAPLSKSALKRQKQKAAAAKKETAVAAVAVAEVPPVENDQGWQVQASRRPRKTKAPVVVDTTNDFTEEKIPAGETLKLEIPSKFYGTLIGSKGATLHLIQEGTGCHIDIPKKDEGEIVTITGSSEGIQRCKATIESLIKTGFSPITHPGMSKNEISVDEKLRPRLVGKKAANLHALQNATNTVINLPQQGKGNKVSIIGSPQDIAQCKALIKQLLTDGYCPATHPGFMKVEMPFPRDKFGILIGPNGGTIKHITNSSGCQLNIPRETDLNQNLTLVGTAEGISLAQKHIKAVLDKEEAELAAQRASLEEEEEYWKVDESALLDVW